MSSAGAFARGLAVAVLLAGCADEPHPPAPTAEELSLLYSPAGQAEAEAEPPEAPASEDDRQSRPARPAGAITPARWDGQTSEVVCVAVPTGCLGVTRSGDTHHSFGVDGRVWRVRVTVTWDAVDDATRELQLRVGQATAAGPSPLSLEVPYRLEERSRMTARVDGIRDGTLVHLPPQPFSAVAEFNV